MQRRTLLNRSTWVALAVTAAPFASRAARAADIPMVEVWKDPSCGCCKDWVRHLNQNGFATRVHDEGNAAARKRSRMPMSVAGCHSATVGGYAIEGHVPAREVHRLLAQKPDALGLAVAGMPIGSPGMDGAAYGGRRDAYDVLLVAEDGRTRVWQAYLGG